MENKDHIVESTKMVTAVEWLVNKLMKGEFINNTEELIEKAKEMEKEALEECWHTAHQAGRFEGKGIAEENWQTFEQYYNEIYQIKQK